MPYHYLGQHTATFVQLPGYKKLVAWQAASDLGWRVGQKVAQFGPGHIRLANQMRGAAISVAGNLAEGYCSGSLGNYLRYCYIARGSLGELGSYLQDCERENLLIGQELKPPLQQYQATHFYLERLIPALLKKQQDGTWDTAHGVKEARGLYVVGREIREPLGTEEDESAATHRVTELPNFTSDEDDDLDPVVIFPPDLMP